MSAEADFDVLQKQIAQILGGFGACVGNASEGKADPVYSAEICDHSLSGALTEPIIQFLDVLEESDFILLEACMLDEMHEIIISRKRRVCFGWGNNRTR